MKRPEKFQWVALPYRSRVYVDGLVKTKRAWKIFADGKLFGYGFASKKDALNEIARMKMRARMPTWFKKIWE